jgi:hypothetical protein
MFDKIKTKIKQDYTSFFEGEIENVIKSLQSIRESQPEGVKVEISLEYSRFSDEEEVVFYAVRDMTEEEKALAIQKEKEKSDLAKKERSEKRAKDILLRKAKGEIVSEKDLKFIDKYLKS